MPFLLVVIGITLIITSAKNNQGTLLNLVQSDFVGPNNFIFWFLSIIIIGSIGYIKWLKPISNAFLVLIVVVLILSEKGFFAAFTSQINAITGFSPSAFSNTQNAGEVVNLGGNSSSTTVVGGGSGGTITIGGGGGNGPTQGCPAGTVYSVEVGDCIDPSGGGGSSDPFGGPFGFQDPTLGFDS